MTCYLTVLYLARSLAQTLPGAPARSSPRMLIPLALAQRGTRLHSHGKKDVITICELN